MVQPTRPFETAPTLTLVSDEAAAITDYSEAEIASNDHDLLLLSITTVEKSFPETNPEARNQVQTIQLPDGQLHRRLHTEPEDADDQSSFHVVNILGFTESIDAEYIQKHHDYLAALLPNTPISTQATYGIDGTAENLTPWQKMRITHDDVAEHAFSAMRLLYPNKPIIAVPTSQGASILARIRALNDEAGNPLTFQDQILYEPYLLTKQQKCLKILSQFIGGHVPIDGARELLTRTDPCAIPGLWWDQAHSMPNFRHDAPALIGHGIGNLLRTDQHLIATMLGHGALILQGTKDCLGCEDTNSLPGVELKRISGKGHSMGMNPRKRAVSIASAIRSRGHLVAKD